MTIGAGPAFLLSGDPLTVDYNRKKDAQLWRKNTLQNLYINNEWVVDNLISNTDYYMKNYQAETDYILIPKKNSQHNSNSFAHGLLNSVGYDVSKPDYDLPGWNTPVPSEKFGQ